MFDELSFQSFQKNEKSKNRNFRNFVHFVWEGVSQFWIKSRHCFSCSTFYPSAKDRRELKIKTPGVIFHGESDFR